MLDPFTFGNTPAGIKLVSIINNIKDIKVQRKNREKASRSYSSALQDLNEIRFISSRLRTKLILLLRQEHKKNILALENVLPEVKNFLANVVIAAYSVALKK